MSNSPHIPVLYNEVLEAFKLLKGGVIVDCTLGYGGHTQALLDQDPTRKVIGIDQDDEALEFSQKRLETYKDRFEAKKGRYSDIFPLLKDENIIGVLADIGVSSLQLDKKERGFSFESPTLDMRMNPDGGLSAWDVVNTYTVPALEKIFFEYGEERMSKKIVKVIDEYRKKQKFTSSKELAELIYRNLPKGKIHPATKIFQAIRIEVNDELGELERLLSSIASMNKEMVVGIITFHSLEDRIVKQAFKEYTKSCICPPEAYRCVCGDNHDKGEILTKKPIEATPEEIKTNPRSRSAKLRLFHFFGEKCD